MLPFRDSFSPALDRHLNVIGALDALQASGILRYVCTADNCFFENPFSTMNGNCEKLKKTMIHTCIYALEWLSRL